MKEHSQMLLQMRQSALDPLLLERLAETGYLASECGMDQQAERIFACLAMMSPGKASPLIGLAIVHSRRGLVDQAISELRAVVAQHPDHEMARAILGAMLAHSRQAGALKMLEGIMAKGKDQAAVEVARSCVELAREQETESKSVNSESLEYFRHYNVRS
jgi:hypothetical protein